MLIGDESLSLRELFDELFKCRARILTVFDELALFFEVRVELGKLFHSFDSSFSFLHF